MHITNAQKGEDGEGDERLPRRGTQAYINSTPPPMPPPAPPSRSVCVCVFAESFCIRSFVPYDDLLGNYHKRIKRCCRSFGARVYMMMQSSNTCSCKYTNTTLSENMFIELPRACVRVRWSAYFYADAVIR